MLEIRDLNVTFQTEDGPVYAVRGVDLDVAAGEVLGIVGESGSGKSVTMLAMLGLLPRTATITGSAKFRGEELIGRKPKDLRHIRGARIAMIFQDPLTALNPVHRVGKQITEAIRAHRTDLERARGDGTRRSSCSTWSGSRGPRCACGSTRTSSRAVCASGP